jgi:polyisoprenoid-binding protein YceI
MKKTLLSLFISCILLSAVAHYSIHWTIGDGYAIKFSTEKVNGAFTELKGKIKFDENNLSASGFDVTVAAASIETGIGLKNKHARGETWFDAAHFPQIQFQSSSVTKVDNGFDTRGLLDLHGVKKFELNRLDYKVGPADGLNGTVGKVLTVVLSVPVVW